MDAQERPSNRREQELRVLQLHELRRVVRALTEEPDHVRTFFLTCLLTGYRRSEVQQMQWEELDLVNAAWFCPASTGKRPFPQTFPLPQALVPYLDQLPRVSPCVFTQAERTNWVNTYVWLTSWKRIQRHAELRPCPTHILRYSFLHYFAQQGSNPARLEPRQLRAAMDEYAQTILN